MQPQLRFISISHHNAATDIRQLFHLTDQEQKGLINSIKLRFEDIKSLMLLSTCNRVEVYFESDTTRAREILNLLMVFKRLPASVIHFLQYYILSDDTLDTATHLMKVSNGFDSRIDGDVQIISQVRAAYALTSAAKLQGKLLERAIQASFRLHKRIVNETLYRNGTVSFGLLSLKYISRDLGYETIRDKRLLIIGAGEIAEEVAKYIAKFPFREICIANRTEARAKKLAQRYALKVIDWSSIEENQLQEYDAIISCVSNRARLIQSKTYLSSSKPKVLVDLAMPGNIEKSSINKKGIYLYDLDTLSEMKDTHLNNREKAKLEAENLLKEELNIFSLWISKLPVHEALVQYQNGIKDEIREFLNNKYANNILPAQLIEDISEALANRLTRKPARKLMEPGINGHTKEYLKIFKELY